MSEETKLGETVASGSRPRSRTDLMVEHVEVGRRYAQRQRGTADLIDALCDDIEYMLARRVSRPRQDSLVKLSELNRQISQVLEEASEKK